jgi:acetylglutamate kinase
MEKSGLKPNFIKGMRVTDEKTVQIVDEVLSNQINPELLRQSESITALQKDSPDEIF